MINSLQRYVLENTQQVTVEIRKGEIGVWVSDRNVTATVKALLKRKLIVGLKPNGIRITLAGKRQLSGIEL